MNSGWHCRWCGGPLIIDVDRPYHVVCKRNRTLGGLACIARGDWYILLDDMDILEELKEDFLSLQES